MPALRALAEAALLVPLSPSVAPETPALPFMAGGVPPPKPPMSSLVLAAALALPPPAVTESVSGASCSTVSALMPSPPAVRVRLPPSMLTQPLAASSALLAWMASPPAVTVMTPALTATLSLPLMPSFTAFTVTVPPVIFKSSLLKMPWL